MRKIVRNLLLVCMIGTLPLVSDCPMFEPEDDWGCS